MLYYDNTNFCHFANSKFYFILQTLLNIYGCYTILESFSGMAEVQILPPIPTAGLTKDDMNQLIEKTYSIMNDAYQKLSQEVRQSSLQED